MRRAALLLPLLAVLPDPSFAQRIRSNHSIAALVTQSPFSLYGDRPPDCPPCFNCNLEDFVCHQFADCSKASGKCACPPGFGGEDCSSPLCGSLAVPGRDRAPPGEGGQCECDDGWEGINCNVCKSDNACSAFLGIPEEDKGNGAAVCYREGLVIKQNYQMCDITNRKILDTLGDGRKPQATFSCDSEDETCNFQFWVDARESFYCALDTCTWSAKAEETRNTTDYQCEHIKCRCIPGRMLCGEDGSIDIGDFLAEEIKGPASFSSISTEGGSSSDGSKFEEPAMNDLISKVFGDASITLNCHAGECLSRTEVPGYERPVKKINTPLIAGVIAGCALFVVAVILLVFFLSRRANRRLGPIHLSDDEEEEGARMMETRPAALSFEHVSYRLGSGRQVLHDISGSVKPGELLAIMGASGAGKTSLLDLLARKNKRGSPTGNFYVNGEKVADDEFRGVIGFVDQEDTMLPTLTVHETILDSAMLRLPRDMGLASKLQRVEEVERQLGIYGIRDQFIGSEESVRGISGGEKRRVGIACELVTSPSILFLDEPTSGLDAFNAFNVIESLVTLCKTYNRTVVFTIHQPRSNIVALFDQLILLAKGRTVYSGPFASCQPYFDGIGYTCPPGFNIADYLVDLTMHAGAEKTPMDSDRLRFSEPDADGRVTRGSSAMAVKSITSTENGTVGGHDANGSPGGSLIRPKGKRRTSIKQQQERQLYTRKKSHQGAGNSTPRIDDSSLGLMDNAVETTQQWLRTSKRKDAPPSQMLDDLHATPPAAPGSTATDLDNLVENFANSEVAEQLHDNIHSAISSANGRPNGQVNGSTGPSTYGKMRSYKRSGLVRQFVILSRRTWRNLYRNPLLLLTHYATSILLAVLLGALFYGLTDNLAGFQNRLGFLFFLLALCGFSCLTSLQTFGQERLLFMRERGKGYYSVFPYYLAKVLFDIIPLRVLPVMIMGAIVYPMTGLTPAWAEFWKFMLFLVLFNLAASSVVMCVGILLGSNAGVANLVGVLVMLFSLLFSGFLLNRESTGKGVRWLQKLSVFHYGFEGLIVNEVRYLSLIDHKYGIDIEVPGSAILSTFGFDPLALWTDAIGLSVFCGVFLVLAYVGMWAVLVERR
ncbi:FAD-dependent urate hydroxylase [Elasticomyces elasticus]|nr:FAD-dependent urate hydroxylase [Elasticomyces elasticus]